MNTRAASQWSPAVFSGGQSGGVATGVCLSAVAIATLVLYWPLVQWTSNKFAASGWHWHWILAGVTLLFACPRRIGAIRPTGNSIATTMFVLCVAAQVANLLTLQVNLLSAVLLILTTHALIGHLISPSRWRVMMWPLVLGTALLPLDFYLEPYLGYPMRLFSASFANQLLQHIAIESLTEQSILMVENRASVVDLDCSGVNSLWAATIFYLLLTWLTGVAIGLRWLALAVLLFALVLGANVLRIVVLVMLDLNGLYGMAVIAHTALGAAGFTLAIIIVWMLAGHLPRSACKAEPVNDKPLSTGSAIVMLLSVLAAVSVANAVSGNSDQRWSEASVEITLDDALHAREVAMTETENRYFNGNGADAIKYQLGAEMDNNSLVLVSSRWWKAQHKPDYCLQSQGLSIDDSYLWTLKPVSGATVQSIYAIRVLRLSDEQGRKFTALYWFQSANAQVADHSARVADAIRHPNRQWTMASLLLSGEVGAADVEWRVSSIQQAIARSYGEKS